MPNANYREIGGPDGLLARKRDFVGNSMSAEWNGDFYEVFSYSTIIARYMNGHPNETWVSDEYYSHTTSRHQNLCRAWL